MEKSSESIYLCDTNLIISMLKSEMLKSEFFFLVKMTLPDYVFSFVINFQLQELNHWFNEHTMKLLIFSSIPYPRDEKLLSSTRLQINV